MFKSNLYDINHDNEKRFNENKIYQKTDLFDVGGQRLLELDFRMQRLDSDRQNLLQLLLALRVRLQEAAEEVHWQAVAQNGLHKSANHLFAMAHTFSNRILFLYCDSEVP